ncbi:Kazal-like serine protease inhibitor [Phytophthora cinnamomi]|uniref:Kazal-like serine protease inhibitor n=1 Tax=Phytophthora cinnamomi TaxID=4785 RepID=UPI003559BA8D|nr:Kazal-like serine protease inhibitor [Phytophthora cinnamomi]
MHESSKARSCQAYESHTELTRQQEVYVRQVTSALHQTEVVLLRSYISIFVLPFYGLYQALIFSLPNRKYFITMATTMTFDAVASMIFHMLVLCCLEILFLVMYMVLIFRRLGFSGIHQLAFVLWSQRILIQGKFVMLPIMILGFPLAHFGNGIIFKIKGQE